MPDETRREIVSELLAYKDANSDWKTDIEKAKIVAAYRNQIASMSPAFPFQPGNL
jgi:hypothetical protein